MDMGIQRFLREYSPDDFRHRAILVVTFHTKNIKMPDSILKGITVNFNIICNALLYR